MGGSAFSSLPDPPYTPRMPPAVYRRALSACNALLSEIFVCVASPIEGPGKKDHGDIDILVALEKRTVFPRTRDDSIPRSPHELMAIIQHQLGAKHAIVHPAGTSAHLTIQWPSDMDQHYVQVDVHICPDIDDFCWRLFKHAHGDLWNILGSTIRPFGLTIDEEALWLRIPEIEKFDRKRAKVCLSRDPVEIIHFLGMKVEGFWDEPFQSVDALFDYATTCRLFWVRDTPVGVAEEDADASGVIGGEDGRRRLKANDRRRMASRPVYRRWINEFIPRLCAEGKFLSNHPAKSAEELRAMVRDEAFERFSVEAEYRERLREWRLKRDGEQMKALVKESVPSTVDPQRRACVVGALKKIILEGDPSFGFDPSGLRLADGFYDTSAVRNFIHHNLEELAKVAWAMQQQRAQEAMLLKASRKSGSGQGIPG
ncbi:uncharacterized protein P884DRAFT_276528 [Thermothelomyces heterothallicus CBS 202.75]|uniref:uncharacterized protein n=1 Tax=Thermothelomyces heterothallicus CBS 202.75 TaxID=1149848 RepID=UPI003744A883